MAGYWYFAEGAENVGPVMWSQLRELLKSGRISHNTLVWQEGMPDWTSMGAALQSMEPETHFSELRAEPRAPASSAAVMPAGSVITDANGWYSSPVHPWRRYFARFLDISFQGLLGVIVLAYVWFSVSPISASKFFAFFEEHQAGPLLDIVLTTFIAAVLGSVFVGITGSSLGKIIFGIKIVDRNLKVIGIGRALGREFHVWLKGLAFGIPLIAIFTMIFSYRKLKKEGVTSWDRDRYTVLYRPAGDNQSGLSVIGFIIICALNALVKYIEKL